MRRCRFWRAAATAASTAPTDPFIVLGLPRSASKDDVKRRYRELAKLHHPDSRTPSSSSVSMEDVNHAYNHLIKEGAYERLAIKSPPPRGTGVPKDGGAGGASSSAAVTGDLDLDPMSERVTPEGTFLYQRRSTGEWVARDAPFSRPDVPRYTSFRDQQREGQDLASELKERSLASERAAAMRTKMSGESSRFTHIEFKSKPMIALSILVYITAVYFMYERLMDLPRKLGMKISYYRDIRKHREKLAEVYEGMHRECDACAAAAAIIFMAAASKKLPTDGVVKAVLSDVDARPPPVFFNLAQTN